MYQKQTNRERNKSKLSAKIIIHKIKVPQNEEFSNHKILSSEKYKMFPTIYFKKYIIKPMLFNILNI